MQVRAMPGKWGLQAGPDQHLCQCQTRALGHHLAGPLHISEMETCSAWPVLPQGSAPTGINPAACIRTSHGAAESNRWTGELVRSSRATPVSKLISAPKGQWDRTTWEAQTYIHREQSPWAAFWMPTLMFWSLPHYNWLLLKVELQDIPCGCGLRSLFLVKLL